MAKQLNVNLAFTADTKAAQTQIQDLQLKLNQLATNNFKSGSALGLTKEVQQATAAVAELQVKLNSAINTDTGKLDLGKFMQSLDGGITGLQKYQQALSTLGPAGDQAFSQLAMSIAQAEMPLRRSSGLVNNLWVSLKNTARWQLSSSILHGFMGAVQSAFGYAQDLNESLNNIRIVTGYNTDQMAKFAEESNRAAKALSTTTTKYTDASLIYFQQGLNDAEVKERTEVTVKMANVAGESVQTVSEQMTAVWNNFADGTKSLEYYGDVMAALGAKTASSVDEIAGGLEKFASIGDTIGLSYEYAAAALATITSNTRQSEEVVGTALKTIFARIQGLNLGETLDDGTTLNKYSEALQKVGISIFDQTGQLKDMDDILDEMGSKWQSLDKAQQAALAQTVAGVRQYTQLIALMDNWDKGDADSFMSNLSTAYDAEGTLQDQADIYAESWEAASSRVRAAAESIYKNLINDEAIIDLLNGFEKILTTIDRTIDGLGGFNGAISALGAIFFKVFSKQISEGLNNFRYNLMSSKKQLEEFEQFKAKTSKMLERSAVDQDTTSSKAAAQAYNAQSKAQMALIQNAKRMSEEEQKVAAIMLDQQQILRQNVIDSGKQLEVEEQKLAKIEKQTQQRLSTKIGEDGKAQKVDTSAYDAAYKAYKRTALEASRLANVNKRINDVKFDNTKQKLADLSAQINSAKKYSEQFSNGLEEAFGRSGKKAIKALDEELKKSEPDMQKIEQLIKNINGAAAGMDASAEKNYAKLREAIHALVPDATQADQILDQLNDRILTLGDAQNNTANDLTRLEMATEAFVKACQNALGATMTFGQKMTAFGQMISTVSMAINSIVGLIDTWNNKDLTFGEKLLSTMTTLGMVLPMVISLFNKENAALLMQGANSLRAVVGKEALTAATIQQIAAEKGAAAAAWASLGPYVIIVAVLAAVAAAVYGLVKAYNADADAAKEAAEASKQAADAFEETKKAVEDLNNALDDIDSQADALDTMTKGTEKWRDAVQALNDDILSLISKYPELAAAVSEVNGVLTIDKTSDAYKEFYNKQKQQVSNARQSYLGSQVNANLKQDKSDITDMTRKVMYVVEDDYAEDGYDTRNATADEIKSVVKLLQDTNNSVLKSKDDFAKGIKDAKLNIEDEALINALWNNREGLTQLAASMDAHASANEVFRQQQAEDYLSQNGYDTGYQGSSFQAAMEEAMANAMGEENTDNWSTSYKGMTDKQVQQAYAEKMGYTWVANKNGGKGEYLNANGDIVEINDTVARYFLNQQDQLAKYAESAKEANQLLEDNKGNEDEQAILEAAFTGNLKGLTEEQLAMGGEDGLTAEKLLENMGFIPEEVDRLTALFGEDFIARIQEVLDATAESIPEDPFNLDQWTNQFNALKDLKPGDTIDPEVWASLDEGMQSFFRKTIEGEYALIGVADQLLNKLKGNLITEIETQQGQIDAGTEAAGDYIDKIGESARGNGVAEGSYNSGMVKAQIDFLKSQGQDTSQFEEKFYDENGNFKSINPEDIGIYDELATAAATAKAEFDVLNATLTENKTTLAMTAESMEDLDEMLGDGKITREIYNAQIAATVLKEAQAEGFDTEEIQDYAQTLESVGNLSEEMALKVALAEKKQAKGADDLVNNYKDYAKVLKSAKLDSHIKGTEQYSKAINSLKKDLSLLTGVSEDAFDEDFINSDEVQQALADVANGVDGATERLKALAVMQDIKLDIDDNDIKTKIDALKTDIIDLNSQDIEIGATINNAPALDALATLMTEAGMTVSQMQDFFNDLGWEPEIEYVEVDAKTAAAMRAKGYQEYAILNPDGSYSINSVPLDGELAQGADQKVYVPRIKTKGGSYKKIDPPGSGSSNNNSSGGGGGGSKAPEKKSSSDKTRYHTIQNQLEDLKSEYEEISEAADRAFGKDKLEHIDDQIAKTEELIAAQEELLGAYGDWDMSGYDPDDFGGFENLRQNLEFDKGVMEAYFGDLFGDAMQIEYDEKGNISNYRELEDYMQRIYNNNTKALKGEKWEAFEKQYEKMQEYIEQYEKTYDELRDAEKEYQDLVNRRMDLELTKIQYAAELNLTISDESLDYIEYQLDLIDDDATKATESVALNAKKAEAIYDKINTTQNAMNDILDQILDSDELDAFYANGYVDWDNLKDENGMEINFTADQIDALKEYRDSLLDMNAELAEIRNTVEEQLLEVFDHWNEKIQDGISAIDEYNGMLDTYRNIIDVVGKDTLGIDDSFIGGLADKQIQGAINSLEATKDAYDSIVATQAKAQEELEKARTRKDEESVKYWEETLETLNENAREAQSELLSSWENALSTIADQFEATVERLVTSFSNSIYSLGGLEGLSEDFSRTQENRDMMIDDYQKIYELSKLTRDINGKLDDTKIIAGKQKLRDLIKEINKYQEEGVKMSQYDLEYLQAEYQLRLAEIELEEAQRAKNTVRMSRDNEGNWSYIYTQNTDAVDAAQQKYEDALYAMQDLSSNYIDEMSEQLISTSQEMQEALAAIRIQDYANINDYYAEVERVQKQYQDELAMQEAELNKAIGNNKELYDTDWTNYHNATGYKISDTKDFATAFRDTLLGTLMDSESDTSNFSTIIGTSVDTLVQGLRNSADQYFQNIATAMEAAGTSTDAFSKDAQEDIDDIIAKSDEGATAVEDMSERMQTAFDTAADNLVLWQETYGTVISAMIEQNEALVESFNKMFEALSATGEDFNIATNIEFKKISSEEPDTGFDTGGYTGEWGKAGKLAILHEKELVLNANDTENLFKTLLLSSQILETIDLNARQASLGMGAMTAAAVKDDSTQTLEQMVHITAEFPGVSDRNELEEAFDNLINRAAQYAYRTL